MRKLNGTIFLCICTLAGIMLSSCREEEGVAGLNDAQATTYPNQMTRLSRIEVHSEYLADYKAALKEGVETSVILEPGVITLYAVQEINKPNHFTILKIYADKKAYEAHIQSDHFQKYKQGTLKMVKALDLIDGTALTPDMKMK